MNVRLLATAFWLSYFALQWLILLGVVNDGSAVVILILHFVLASVLSVNTAATKYRKEKK